MTTISLRAGAATRTTRLAARSPRIAIAHDYLTQRGGAERVVLSMLRAFPDATVYTTLYDPDGTFPEFRDAHIVTSRLNAIPQLRRNHRLALPLLPLASRSITVDADVVLASSSGWAHGFTTRGRRVVYCHNTARWLYQADEYLDGLPLQRVAKATLGVLTPSLRRWDRRSAASSELYLANSSVVSERVRRAYGIDADIVHAPHTVDPAGHRAPVAEVAGWDDERGYHLIVSRLMPYKNVGAAIEAFRGLDERLVVVGNGPLKAELQRDLPPNVRLLSDLADSELRSLYAGCRALIAPSHEDFGLTPLEASAYGKPTLALRAGGYLETVLEGVSGAYFATPAPSAIRTAVLENRDVRWDRAGIVAHSERFSERRFHASLVQAVEQVLDLRPAPSIPVQATDPDALRRAG